LRTGSGLFVNTSENVSVPPTRTTAGNQQSELGPLIPVEEFIVNLIGEDITHYLKISMSIEVSDKETGQELLQRMPQVRDAILLLASNKTFEELYDLYGKKQLKAELLVKINEILTHGSAKSIYFTDFVIQ
jgi:flagellar FliL protein